MSDSDTFIIIMLMEDVLSVSAGQNIYGAADARI